MDNFKFSDGNLEIQCDQAPDPEKCLADLEEMLTFPIGSYGFGMQISFFSADDVAQYRTIYIISNVAGSCFFSSSANIQKTQVLVEIQRTDECILNGENETISLVIRKKDSLI